MGAMKRAVARLLVAVGAFALGGGTAGAHDDIASSTPESGAMLDAPIAEVTVDFGEEVGDVEMALIGPDDQIVQPATVTQTSPTTARLEFPELETEGVYFVRYLAPVTADGHTLAGAITFTYGDAGGSSNVVPILLFCFAAVVVLSIGAFFSWRRYRALRASEVDEDLADVGV